jgi:hypothetical protein
LPILQTILGEKDWDVTSELSDSDSIARSEMKDSITGKKYSNRDEYVGISNLTLDDSCNEDSTITSITPSLTVKIPQALHGDPEKITYRSILKKSSRYFHTQGYDGDVPNKVRFHNHYHYTELPHLSDCLKELKEKMKDKILSETMKEITDQTNSISKHKDHVPKVLKSYSVRTGKTPHFLRYHLLFKYENAKYCKREQHMRNHILSTIKGINMDRSKIQFRDEIVDTNDLFYDKRTLLCNTVMQDSNISPPPGMTDFLLREGVIFDMRGATMSELIEKIMDCRYDDGELSPEIQIDIDQQIELSKYLFEPEKLKIVQTREKLDQALIDAELDKPCIARVFRRNALIQCTT